MDLNKNNDRREISIKYEINILVLGRKNTGKSTLIKTYTEDHSIDNIGIDLKIKIIDIGDAVLMIRVWDTNFIDEKNLHTQLASAYYRSCDGIIYVTDVEAIDEVNMIKKKSIGVLNIDKIDIPIKDNVEGISKCVVETSEIVISDIDLDGKVIDYGKGYYEETIEYLLKFTDENLKMHGRKDIPYIIAHNIKKTSFNDHKDKHYLFTDDSLMVNCMMFNGAAEVFSTLINKILLTKKHITYNNTNNEDDEVKVDSEECSYDGIF